MKTLTLPMKEIFHRQGIHFTDKEFISPAEEQMSQIRNHWWPTAVFPIWSGCYNFDKYLIFILNLLTNSLCYWTY